MAEITPETAAAGRVFDYAHYTGDAATSDAFRQQLVSDLKSGNDIPGFSEALNQRLIDSGTIPDLLIKDWDKIDTDNSGEIELYEANDAFYSNDPLIRLVGQAIGDARIIPGSVNGRTLSPGITYDDALLAASDVPEQRPGGDALPPAVAPGELPPAVAPGEIPPPAAILPADAAVALSDLQNPLSTPEQKLKDIEALVKAGQTTATIKDAEGNCITVRLELAPIAPGSTKNFVHMFAVDPATGKETVMMRAISDGTTISQQRDANGNEVGFFGKKWMQQNPKSMFKS